MNLKRFVLCLSDLVLLYHVPGFKAMFALFILIKVKLRMTLEQEIVRLFGDYARKAAGYGVPFSACSVIMSQMGSLERGIKVRCRIIVKPF